MSPDGLPPVLIIGAGPTGMTAALDLAHYGIPSLVLDDGHTLSEGSRALVYHQSALAVWEKLGAGADMLAQGIAWSVRHTYHGEKMIFDLNIGQPAPGMLPRYLNLPQFDVETHLLECIRANPLIDLRWDHRVTGFSQDAGGVTLEVETTAGNINLRGQYALACDGARSTMRKLLGLEFPGRTFNDFFLIADIRADLKSPPEPRFYFDHPTNPGQTLLIHPQPGGIWRIDWQIGTDVDITVETGAEKMERRIRALIGDTPYEIVWLSAYRFHQRLLEQFRHGRVFFAGDAAHLVSPFGARGLNSAIQDVENLVWKLAFVLKGLAPETLLDTYQTERWPAQAENQRVTINTMRFMAPSTPALRLRRNLVLWLSGFYSPARKWVDSGRMSVPFTYTTSPLVAPDLPGESWAGAPAPGSRPADAPVILSQAGLQTTSCLRSLFGSGFVALVFESRPGGSLQFTLPAEDIPLRIIPVRQAAGASEAETIIDPRGDLAQTLGAQPGSLYLFRPDGHLALRRRSHGPQTISAYLSEFSGQK